MPDRSIPDSDRAEIERRLQAIESEFGVSILFACESGSRAWGFASSDSDYDVRFVYVSPPAWYLSVDEQRDVIERPIEGVWDVNGWDLRKALRLYRKSNPPLLEWLQSPIVYRDHTAAAEKMRDLLPDFYSPASCMYHYLRMAQNNYRSYLQGPSVRTKKYFYSLRPLLACHWIEADRGAVPMEFENLLATTRLSSEARLAIADLLEQKRAGAELKEGPRVPVLNEFIESEFARLESNGVPRRSSGGSVSQLSTILQETLVEVWGHLI